MAVKPKPAFWVVVLIVVFSLIGFALYRAGLLPTGDKSVSPAKQGGASSPAGKSLEITFYSSNAKKEWVDDMVNKFNTSGYRVGDKTIKVKQFHILSGESLDALKEGKLKADLWSPGDESWLEMAAVYWKDAKQKVLFEKYTPLVNIPLVITIWEPMAKVLGHPNPIGWTDIAKVASNPKGWAAYGHPEWGKFRWGHAHLDSNSGYLTIISEIYAILGKTEGITVQDLKKPEVISFLKEFEGSVEHYGLSNTWIDDLMHAKGPAYLSAAVQYENTIIETNEKHQNKPFKLVSIYPKEGNFWTQHPVAILKEDWMTPEKEEACKKFIDFLLSKENQRRAMEMGLRPIIKDIQMAAPFDDSHGVNPDVTAERMFKVPDEAVLKRIRDLWEDVKTPATVVMLLDRSGSMKGTPLDNAKAGAIQFIKNMKPRDQVMITVFNNTVTTISELCFIRDCGESAASRVDGIFADGGTALHDSISAAYALLLQLKKQDSNRRYCILLLTDGQDTASKVNRHDFLDTLPRGEDYDAPKIYSIAYGSEADKNLLAEISSRTNARLFMSSPEEIKKTYRELSANF